MTIEIPDNGAELLRGILLDYKDQLEQNQEGEPWQPEELALTNALISAIQEQSR